LETAAAGSPVPVHLVVVPERLPEHVEVAAYYLVCEALSNIAKHSNASAASVVVVRDGPWAVVEIVDDGTGGADTANGSGLRGLADRVAALAGHLAIESPPGGGTHIRAEIPCV
jgi:signal transduction histidine kinase